MPYQISDFLVAAAAVPSGIKYPCLFRWLGAEEYQHSVIEASPDHDLQADERDAARRLQLDERRRSSSLLETGS